MKREIENLTTTDMEIGDTITCLYPSGGEGVLKARIGVVEQLEPWGFKIHNIDTGEHRSLNWHKAEKIKIIRRHDEETTPAPRGWNSVD